MAKADDNILRDWPIDPNKTDVERVAEYLHEASKKFPGRPIPITYIVRVANAMQSVPRDSNKAVEAFRKTNRMGRVGTILIDQYRCELLHVRGVGYCAAFDSNHIQDTKAEQRARNVYSAIKRMERTMKLIKPSELSGKERKERYRTLANVADLLVSSDVKGRLLLSDPDKKKNDGE